MFKVPDWGGDVPNTNIDFSRHNSKKLNKRTQKVVKLTNHVTKGVVKPKNKKKKQININGVNKINENDALKTLTVTTAQLVNKNKNLKKSKNNNNLKNPKIKHEKKVKLIDNHLSSIENSSKNTNKRKQMKQKNFDDKLEGDLEVNNLNIDLLDEVIINAKKKRLNEQLESDDKEDLLFKDITKLSKKMNTKDHNTSDQNETGNNAKHKKQRKALAAPKEIKNKLAKDIKKKDDSISKTIKNVKESKEMKIEPAVNPQTPSIKKNGISKQSSKVEEKKQKLRMMLKSQTLRNHININGNKLRERMMEKLKAAQFRYLNEKLYTTSGSEAQKLFQQDPLAFKTYHEGYQQQVKKWPVNPLDLIVKRIRKMPQTFVVADMGCGSASLSVRVRQRVRSFDLLGDAARGVEACDMAHTPLQPAAVDVTVYCLALMGTDLTQYLLEANRVLKPGGHLLIAEVESRFDKVETFVNDVERLGFKLKHLDQSNSVFFFMEFNKVRDPPVKKSKLPALSLKPCLYKKR